MRNFGPRRWAAALAGAVAVALAIGLPTVLIPNPVFSRMTPVLWWNWPVLVATSVLSGLLLATYVRQPSSEGTDRPARRGGIAGALAYFAVGCPVCNKLVVVALGTSGAMSWFAPLQPLLAVLSIGLLTAALRARLRGESRCVVAPVPTASAPERR